MAPRDKDPFGTKFPKTEGNWWEKYGKPKSGNGWYEDELASYKMVSDARKRHEGTGGDREMDNVDRLLEKIIDYKSDMKPSLLKQVLLIGKFILIIILLIPVFILADIPRILRALFKDPVDFLKFLGSLMIVGTIKIFEILLALHAVYVILVIVLLLLAGVYFVIYNPYISPSPTVDLHLKSPDGKATHITNNRSATNVTYAQVLQFLEQDDTDKTLGKYQTARVLAAVKLHDNAEIKGIRAGVAEVGLDNMYAPSYCWNVFDTTDQGTIYVTAYHPALNENSDSLVYLPKSGEHEGQIFFVPIDQSKMIPYDSLTEDMGKTAVGGKVTSINAVW